MNVTFSCTCKPVKRLAFGAEQIVGFALNASCEMHARSAKRAKLVRLLVEAVREREFVLARRLVAWIDGLQRGGVA